MRTFLLGTVLLSFIFVIVFAGCKKTNSSGGPSGPPSGSPSGPGKFGPGTGNMGKRPIALIMLKLTKGPQSLTSVIGAELKAEPPQWEKLQPQAKEFAKLAGSMGELEPPKGSKESWAKHTSAYHDAAVALANAVQAKDKDAAVASHQTLASSCMGCHREHRGMGGFGPPGPYGKFGPRGKPSAKGSPPSQPEP